MKNNDFVHPHLNEEILSISSHYVFLKEVRYPYNGKEILYYTGYSVTDKSCCGIGGSSFSYVPGFIINWHTKQNENGDFISEIEPIRDDNTMREISKLLKQKEICTQVNFI
ncbi:MAG: hypothetical protein SVZ03_16460 [Spirochaetota bacterium]|nr:hypothetical protein [Spirochaetota bacterium]